MNVEDIVKMITDINEQKKTIEEKYGKKIAEINKKMEDLQTHKNNSEQYIEFQRKKLEKQLDEIIDAQKVKLKQFGENITSKLAETQAKAVYDQAKNIASRFGIRLP